MMELDDIKQLLHAKLEKESIPVSYAEIAGQLRQNTKSITSKIRKTVLTEFLACAGFFVAALLTAAWYQQLPIYWFCGATVLFSAGFGFYLLRLYGDVKRYDRHTHPVKRNLEKLINILGRFIRLYFIATVAFLPLIFVFGIFVGYMDVNHRHLQEHFSWTKGISLYAGLYGIWSVLIIVFAKWYINRLYGRHLQHLKAMLQDIENG